jgi:hypothetical protein
MSGMNMFSTLGHSSKATPRISLCIEEAKENKSDAPSARSSIEMKPVYLAPFAFTAKPLLGGMAFKVISHSVVTATVVEDKIEKAPNSPKSEPSKVNVALDAEEEGAWTQVMTNKIAKGKRGKKKGKKSRRAKKEKVKPSAESLARFGITDYKSQNTYGVDRKKSKKSKKNAKKVDWSSNASKAASKKEAEKLMMELGIEIPQPKTRSQKRAAALVKSSRFCDSVLDRVEDKYARKPKRAFFGDSLPGGRSLRRGITAGSRPARTRFALN